LKRKGGGGRGVKRFLKTNAVLPLKTLQRRYLLLI
jgi:hypothetical protein